MTRPRFLVTRPAAQGEALVRALDARGIDGIHVPTVAIRAADPAELVAALRAEAWDWVVVTSVNGAATLGAAAHRATLSPTTRVAAVGQPTAAALLAAGMRVDHVPEQFVTLAIAAGLGPLEGTRVLLARADAATPDLRDALRGRGARVREVTAYHTVEGPPGSRDPLVAALNAGLDGITFTSGSTVRGLVALLSPEERAAIRRSAAACIGPVTAAEAVRHGFAPRVVAEPHTAAALAEAVAQHLAMELPA